MMLLRTRLRWLAPAVVVLASCSSPASRTAPPATKGDDIPKFAVESYTLGNGLKVMLSQQRQLPMVAVDLWYHVGPANEAAGRTGFAHLFEHMMFQCSRHVPCDSHLRLLEAAGASDLNGTTDYDRTNYFETVPANQLELALWLESDRMGYLLDKVDQAALSNQQDVVRNERRQSVENQPYGLADEALVQLLYPQGHPYYGNVIGSHADIQAAKLEDVKNFFKQYYAPNNAGLAIVGDFDPAQVKSLIEKYFGTLKRGEPVPPITAATPKITAERRKTVPSRVELPRVMMAWLTSPIFKPGDAEADIAATILGGGRSSRLYKKLVYEKQIAQDVSVTQQSLTLGSQFRVDVTARPGHTPEEIEKAINEEMAAFLANPPDATEVERARNTIETEIIGGLERLGGFGGIADRLNSYNHYLGTPDFLSRDIQRYRDVTPASIQSFAREQLQPTARAVVYAVPGQPKTDPGPPASPVTKAAAAQGAESINPDEPWRNEMPPPGPARALQLATPQTATLANGLTLILSERRNVPVVAANLVLKTGSDANPASKPGLASFVAAMLDEGTTSRSAPTIADEVARLGGSLNTGSSMDASTVSARSLSKNFPQLLGILADVALNPSFPQDEIERQRAIRLGQLVQQRENPSQLAAQVTAAALYGPQHPYGFTEIGTEAAVKAMSKDDMQAFWKQNFVPNNAALVVAGDISMADLRVLVDKSFGGWQRGTPAQPALGAPVTTSAKVTIVDKPGAPQTQVRVATIGAARSSPDFRAMQVMNLALGGLFASRINMNLREQHGYTYGASSQFSFRKSAGPFQVGSGVRTDVTGPAIGEIFKEIRGIGDKAMDERELTGAKTSMINSLPGEFETSSDTVGNLANIFIYGLPLDYYSHYAEQVAAVTPEQALAMAKKYLGQDRLIVVVVGDRAKIEPQIRKLNLGSVAVVKADAKPVTATR